MIIRTLNKMTRILTLIFILALVSCGGNSDQSKTADTKTTTNIDKKTGNKPKSKKGDKPNRSGNREGRSKWNKGKQKPEDVVINVEAENVYKGDAISVFKTTTILEANLESAVTSKASGIVLKLNAEVGDVVKEGDVLAILESDLQQLRLESANANYKKSLHNYERAKTLLKKGLTNKESVENLKFDTQSLKTNLDQAKLDLAYTKIKAPISGMITKRNIKKGNLIQTNTQAYEIVNFDSIQAVINVPENKWGLFENGLEVLFDFANIEETIKGEILRMDPIVDSSTGTFKVVISIHKSTAKLRPGLFGKTQIIIDKHPEAILVTKNALIREDDSNYVYVINEDNSVTKTPVEIGYEMDDTVEILTKLNEGQQVVTTGKNNVSPESKVEIIEYND